MKKFVSVLSIFMFFMFFMFVGVANASIFGNDNDKTDVDVNNTNLQAQNQNQTQSQNQGQFQTSKNTNLNVNSNKNTNKNTAVGVSSANNVNDVKASTDVTFEGDEREFPVQGTVNFGQLVSYFGKQRATEQFFSIKQLTMYSSVMEVAVAEEMIEGNTFGKHVKIVPAVNEVSVPSTSVKIVGKRKISTTRNNVEVLGFGITRATSENAISAGLLASAVVKSAAYGATHIQFLGEGTITQLQASGWGIGFNTTKVDSNSSVQTGGTGYSSAKSSNAELPWQQFIVLKVTEKE